MAGDKKLGMGVVTNRIFKYSTDTKPAFGPDDARVSIPVYEFEIGNRRGDMPKKIVKGMRNPYESGDILVMHETAISKTRYVERFNK